MLLSAVDLSKLRDTLAATNPQHFSLTGSTLWYQYYTSQNRFKGPIKIVLSVFITSHKPSYTATFTDLVLVPYLFLLLTTLAEWDAQRSSRPEGGPSESETNLANRIRRMLRPHVESRFRRDDHLFDPALYQSSKDRVQRFLSQFQDLSKDWRRVGLDMEVPRSPLKALVIAPPPASLPAPAHSPVSYFTKTAVSNDADQMTQTEVAVRAAHAAVQAIHRLGFRCAIFGSMACKLYGNNRNPNDVDILVIPSNKNFTQAELKMAIVAADPAHFYLRTPKNPEATYRVLHYRLNVFTPVRMYQVGSKVDVLLPGIMHLPALPPPHTAVLGGLPAVPFSVLLLQKLQGWDDHRTAAEARYTRKAPVDARDVAWMLSVVPYMNFLEEVKPWGDRALFSAEFEQLSRARVKAFCGAFPQHAAAWERLGFDTW